MSTPMRRQYLALKKQYPGVILFFRLGDFYETFDEDARTVAEVCDIVLTSRPVGNEQRVPLAGVPHHAADGYIAKLVCAGYKVAIAEQMGETTVKGLVPREVRRVVTPGTLVEPGLLEAKSNNYLVALVMEQRRAGVAYADISTGEFATTQFSDDDIIQRVAEELERLHPAEVIVPSDEQSAVWTPRLAHHALSPEDAWRFDLHTAQQALLDHFKVGSLAAYGCEGKPLAVRAAGGLVQYLRQTGPDSLAQLDSLRTYSTAEFMILDASTWRNLELVQTIQSASDKGSLLKVLDDTRTAMGGRLLRRWLGQPLLDVGRINDRLDGVQAWAGDMARRIEVRDALRGIGDLERWTARSVQGIVRPRELLGLREALERVPSINMLVEAMPWPPVLNHCQGVLGLLRQAIADEPPATPAAGGVIRPGFSAELDGIAAASRDAKEWIAGLERAERERTGVKSLKVGYNKVFGYYVEVTKANQSRVPENYIRKQTLVNAERYITPELKEYESLVLNAQERLLDLEASLYRQVVDEVAAAAPLLRETAAALGQLDVISGLAEVAVSNRYVRPTVGNDGRLDIIAGRHPVVELFQREEPFQPNDVHLSPEDAIMILTGPNMSGKSTYLRQVALIVLMAQIGSFVPADEARIGVVDRIFTRIGAADDIAAGRSTFMVEMVETANILHHATARSLLILDEVGRGTSTYDGMSIAWAVVEYIHNHPRLQAKTLFATHYHELTELADLLPRVSNHNVAVAEEGDDVVFLHRIVPGSADRSYGIHVAQLAGLPRAVLMRAAEILAVLEQQAPGGPLRRGSTAAEQLPLFLTDDPVLEELRRLDITQLTPLEALNTLYKLQQQMRE